MSCPICQKHLGDQEKVVLREKGAAGINTWAHSLRVIAGTPVHTECRRKHTRPEKRDNPPKTDSAKRLTRSSTGGFDFRLNCLLCTRFVTDREKQSGKVHMVQCKNEEVDRAIADAILRRQKDEWSLEVKGRFEFVNDLHAEDAIYHGDCNSLFRSGKGKPGVDTANSSRKRGRPTINEKIEALEEIVEYLCQSDNEQITISKLNDMMKEKVSGKPYFVFVIYYEGSLAFSMSVILFCCH